MYSVWAHRKVSIKSTWCNGRIKNYPGQLCVWVNRVKGFHNFCSLFWRQHWMPFYLTWKERLLVSRDLLRHVWLFIAGCTVHTATGTQSRSLSCLVTIKQRVFVVIHSRALNHSWTCVRVVWWLHLMVGLDLSGPYQHLGDSEVPWGCRKVTRHIWLRLARLLRCLFPLGQELSKSYYQADLGFWHRGVLKCSCLSLSPLTGQSTGNL